MLFDSDNLFMIVTNGGTGTSIQYLGKLRFIFLIAAF